MYNRRYANEDAREHEGQKTDAVCRESRQARRPPVAPDGEDVPAPGRVATDQLHHHKQDEEDEHGVLYAEDRPGSEDARFARDAGDPGSSGYEQDHAAQRV